MRYVANVKTTCAAAGCDWDVAAAGPDAAKLAANFAACESVAAVASPVCPHQQTHTTRPPVCADVVITASVLTGNKGDGRLCGRSY